MIEWIPNPDPPGEGREDRAIARRYGVACLAVAVATGLKVLLGPFLGQESPFLLYSAAIMVSALYGGAVPGLLAVACSTAVATYLFLPPYYSFIVGSPEVRVRLVVFVVESVFISLVCGALRSARRRLEASRADFEAQAAERQRLLVEAEVRRRAAEALTHVGTLITKSLDPRDVQWLMVDSVRRLFEAQRTALYILDPESGDLVVQAGSGASPAALASLPTFSPGMGLVGLAVKDRRPMSTADVLQDPRVQLTAENRALIEQAGVRAALVVPLLSRGTVLGALTVGDWGGRVFTDDDARVAQTFAGQAAIMLEHARLYERAEQRAENLTALTRLTKLMTSAADNQEVFHAVAEAATRLLGAAASRVWADDPAAQELRTQSSFGTDGEIDMLLTDFPTIPYGQGLVGRIFESRQPEYVRDIADEPRWLNRRLATEGGLCGFAGLPLITGDRVVGVLALLFREQRKFTVEDKELMGLLADAAAIAIDTARLLAEERLGRAHLASLLEINKTIGTVRSTEILLNLIAEEAARLLGVDNAGFRLLEGDDLVLAGCAGTAHETMLRPRIRAGEGMSGKVLAEGRALILEISGVPDAVPEHLAADQRLGYSAFLGVPVKTGSRILGVLTFRARRPFTPRDQALAEAFAGQAAIAIEHARLDRQSRQQAEQMKALADLGRALSETLEVEVVAARVGGSMRALLGVRFSVLYLLEPGTADLVGLEIAPDIAAALGEKVVFPRGTGVSGLAVERREPVATPNLLADPRITLTLEQRARIERAPYRSVLAVPLRVHDRVIGALSVGDREGREFSADEIALAQAFADHASLALGNARLYREVQSAYEELSRTQAQLVRAETLRATGELAAGAAHHLNNLLAVALGRVQMLLYRSEVPEVRRHMEPAERALRDSAEVVRRLSAFSRAQPRPQVVPVDLAQIATEVIELTRARWESEAELRGARIDVRLERGETPSASGDPASLREVLVNLVLNAVDALPRGGQVRIKTWASPAKVHCSVTDTGVGMSPEIQRRALDPFFTTKGVKNTGLGLSVNYGIIQRHGGDLTIESVEGQGTTVHFWLVAAPPPDEPGPATGAQALAPRHILLVDDDIAVRQVMAEMLAEDGHVVTDAASGPEGLVRLAAGTGIDLVLTDLGMPGMTGWDVARAVKSTHPSVMVGLITGWGEDPQGTPEERAAVDFVLAKPVTREALRAQMVHIPRARSAAPRV